MMRARQPGDEGGEGKGEGDRAIERPRERKRAMPPGMVTKSVGEGEPSGSSKWLGAPHDEPRPWEDGPPSQEHPGLAEHDHNLVEAAVAKAIEQYQQQRGRGSVPGGFAPAAADMLHPKVDPARELLAKVKYAVGCTSGFGDFAFTANLTAGSRKAAHCCRPTSSRFPV